MQWSEPSSVKCFFFETVEQINAKFWGKVPSALSLDYFFCLYCGVRGRPSAPGRLSRGSLGRADRSMTTSQGQGGLTLYHTHTLLAGFPLAGGPLADGPLTEGC